MVKSADYLISDKRKKRARICARLILHAFPLALMSWEFCLSARFRSSLVSARSELCKLRLGNSYVIALVFFF